MSTSWLSPSFIAAFLVASALAAAAAAAGRTSSRAGPERAVDEAQAAFRQLQATGRT